jgi:hypothetical protein
VGRKVQCQNGDIRKEHSGRKTDYYSFFYRDRITPDGNARSVKERFDHGKVGEVSELSARREHDRLRQKINRERGSVPTAPKGETFKDAADAYIESIAPHLSCSTVRQRQSHLRFPCYRDSVQRRSWRSISARNSDSLPKCWKPTAVKRFSMCWELVSCRRIRGFLPDSRH